MIYNPTFSLESRLTKPIIHRIIVMLYSAIAILGSISTFKLLGYYDYVQIVTFVCLFLAIALIGYLRIQVKLVLIVPIVYFLLRTCNPYVFPSSNFYELVVFASLAFFASLRMGGFLLLDEVDRQEIYKILYSYLVVISVLGIIAYALYLLNVPSFWRTPYHSGSKAYYLNYGFSLLLPQRVFPRLCGLFYEPGQLGTFLAFALCVENFDFKYKNNIILFISGCLTFSLAFFIISFAYMAMTPFYKSRLSIVLAALLCVFVGSFSINMIHASRDVQKFLNRFEIVDGKLRGDNRSTPQMDLLFQDFLNGEHIVWGFGSGYAHSIARGHSAKEIIIDHGILGGTLYFILPLLFCVVPSYKNWRALAFIACFFLSAYQRPEIYQMPMLILLFGGIDYIKYRDTLRRI